jgi:hypothetical protein
MEIVSLFQNENFKTSCFKSIVSELGYLRNLRCENSYTMEFYINAVLARSRGLITCTVIGIIISITINILTFNKSISCSLGSFMLNRLTSGKLYDYAQVDDTLYGNIHVYQPCN